MGIGERLARERRERGLSRFAAAAQMGVSVSALRQWEEGSSEPTPANRGRAKLWLREGLRFSRGGKVGPDGEAVRYEGFARRVLMMRVRFGLSQAEMAAELELAPSTVQGWEGGRAMPSPFNLERLEYWERGRSSEARMYRQDESDVYSEQAAAGKPAKVLRKGKKFTSPSQPKERVEVSAVWDNPAAKKSEEELLKEKIFGDFGNQKAPWECPKGHPKRTAYDNSRDSNRNKEAR